MAVGGWCQDSTTFHRSSERGCPTLSHLSQVVLQLRLQLHRNQEILTLRVAQLPRADTLMVQLLQQHLGTCLIDELLPYIRFPQTSSCCRCDRRLQALKAHGTLCDHLQRSAQNISNRRVCKGDTSTCTSRPPSMFCKTLCVYSLSHMFVMVVQVSHVSISVLCTCVLCVHRADGVYCLGYIPRREHRQDFGGAPKCSLRRDTDHGPYSVSQFRPKPRFCGVKWW